MANTSFVQFRADETMRLKAASRIAAENGAADMTLDEINAEISAARE